MTAHASANAIVNREIVLTIPLPEDQRRRGEARPKSHRFRSHFRDLGIRLRAFRRYYGFTQAEVARFIGAGNESTVCQWEMRAHVPPGVCRLRLLDLLEGRHWQDISTSVRL